MVNVGKYTMPGLFGFSTQKNNAYDPIFTLPLQCPLVLWPSLPGDQKMGVMLVCPCKLVTPQKGVPVLYYMGPNIILKLIQNGVSQKCKQIIIIPLSFLNLHGSQCIDGSYNIIYFSSCTTNVHMELQTNTHL